MSRENVKKIKSKKMCRSKKKKNKLVLVFDENARREFLTGFHKRKLQRKTRAKEELEKQLKIERKRIKAEAKEQCKKYLLSQKPKPDLTDIVSENIDMGTHSVSVTELSASDLAEKNNWIGINEMRYYERKNEKELNTKGNECNKEKKLEGMEVKKKKFNDGNPADSYKELKKKIKKQATNNVKNSVIFKKKAKLEKIKNIKLKKKQERKLEKLNKKKNKQKQS